MMTEWWQQGVICVTPHIWHILTRMVCGLHYMGTRVHTHSSKTLQQRLPYIVFVAIQVLNIKQILYMNKHVVFFVLELPVVNININMQAAKLPCHLH